MLDFGWASVYIRTHWMQCNTKQGNAKRSKAKQCSDATQSDPCSAMQRNRMPQNIVLLKLLCCDVKLRKNVCCFLWSRQSCALIQNHSNGISGECVLQPKNVSLHVPPGMSVAPCSPKKNEFAWQNLATPTEDETLDDTEAELVKIYRNIADASNGKYAWLVWALRSSK